MSHAAGKPLRTGMYLAEAASVSGDGNWVVFASEASDLVAGQDDSEVRRNIYLWERATGTTRPGQPPGRLDRRLAEPELLRIGDQP